MSEVSQGGNCEKHLLLRLPRSLTGAAALVAGLWTTGEMDEIGEQFRVARRAGGFAGVDAVIFLLSFFSSGWRTGGLRGFAEAHAPFGQALAALAGRARLMGQASLSRLLESVDVAAARDLGRRLLRDHVGSLELLRSTAVQTTDARGEAWHVFDFDPNREVYRRRELARPEARPSGTRLTEAVALPGHRGRKRGEVVLTQGMLSHHGSGLWLDAGVTPGNGDPREMLGGALRAVVECCDALGHERRRALVRADGEFRGVPSFAAAKSAGVALLTRLSRYDMFEDAGVRKRLFEGTWERVDDAGGGPVRVAADLGIVRLEAGETTVDETGAKFAPVDVRVVISAYRCPDGTRDAGRRGHRIGDTIFEMFGSVGLSTEAWSPGDVVSTYYGRCGQENRFAQADRELGIDRNFSFAPGGHLLALVCALAVWNWRIVQAVRGMPLPAPTAPPARTAQTASAPEVLSQELTEAPVEQRPDPIPAALAEFDDAMADAAIQTALLARALPWDPAERLVTDAQCEAWELGSAGVYNAFPTLTFVRRESDGRRRHLSVSVPIEALLRVREAMKAVRGHHTRTTIRTLAAGPLRQRPAERPVRLHPEPAFLPESRPGRSLGWPLFLPARAREHTIRDLVGKIMEVDCCIFVGEAVPGHPLLAQSIEAVRRRRWSWTARLARMAARGGPSRATLVSRASGLSSLDGR